MHSTFCSFARGKTGVGLPFTMISFELILGTSMGLLQFFLAKFTILSKSLNENLLLTGGNLVQTMK